ncbi:MAG: tetratricopeptide repeat protein [Gammaproteobacteria bacterium]|nr:tetratricopeptide repeat protein [Gammaproteobacteria bacterium]
MTKKQTKNFRGMSVRQSVVFLMALMMFAGCAKGVQLQDVSHPDLSDLEPGVQKRLMDGRLRIESADGGRRQQSENWGNMGMLYQAYEMYGPAQTSYANAIALDEDNFRWPYLLAFSHQRLGNYAEAGKYYRRAMRLDPDYLGGWIHLGQVYLDDQQLDKAGAAFSRVLKIEPDDAAALTGMARFHIANRDFERAIDPLKRALEIQPTASQLHYYLAMAYRQTGDRELARLHIGLRGSTTPWFEDKLLIELSALHRNSRTYLDNGLAAFERGDLVGAAESYRLALESRPGDATTHLALSWVLELLGKSDAARVQVELSLELDPNSAKAHYSRARLLEEAGDDSQAAKHYLIAIAGDPHAEPPKLLLANLRMRQKQFQQAVVLFQQIDDADNSDVLFLFRLALSLHASGDCLAAIAPLERALAIQADSGTLNLALIRSGSSCPLAEPADKRRWLALARQMFGSLRGLESAEALAMALAANGEFSDASRLQRSLLTSMPGGGAKKFVRENLEKYELGLAAVRPWSADSQFYFPPSASLADKWRMAGLPTAP